MTARMLAGMLTADECYAEAAVLRERAATLWDDHDSVHLQEMAAGWEALAAHSEMHELMADVLIQRENTPGPRPTARLRLVSSDRTVASAGSTFPER